MIAVSDPFRLSDGTRDALRYGGILACLAALGLLGFLLMSRRRRPAGA